MRGRTGGATLGPRRPGAGGTAGAAQIGEARLLGALAAVIRGSRADAVSVCARASRRQVFRFAYEAIHQDLVQERLTVTVRVILGRRVGVASTETLTPKGLARCVQSAMTIAKHAPAQKELPPLPTDHRIRSREDFVPSTARMTPGTCVERLKRLFQLSKGAGAELAGSLATGEDELAVANSAGVSSYAASTVAGIKLVTMFRTLSGYVSGVHNDLRQLDVDELLQRSLRQSLHRADQVRLPLGTYEVILEPEAVADLMTWLGATAFGAKAVQERTSCLTGRMGERLFDPRITIYDDGTESAGLRLPFDFEGTPKRRVVLIDRGKAAGIVYDTTYGLRFGHPSTGHAMWPDSTEGPLPMHLAVAPGAARLSEMIRGCTRGLLIPRFHYVNGLLNPREALMTGLTREGAFLIEHGTLAAPVATLRFTQSLLEAFSRVIAVSKERRLIADPNQDDGCSLMPALHLARFRFTGRSDV